VSSGKLQIDEEKLYEKPRKLEPTNNESDIFLRKVTIQEFLKNRGVIIENERIRFIKK
jgi:hypothetical protein